MRHLVVGTAGHIDHGKSALVEALTGVHPDRLKEEQRRGITIELGFADLELPPEGVVSFVDVPGHERFVRHMVAGATGLDAVVLVVAADEGVKPQTREHVAICDLLGVRHGVVVLSKADLVEPELLQVVAIEVRELLSSAFLRDVPVLPVSSKTGAGLDELRAALRGLLRRVAERPSSGVARLPIDRSFVLRGFGTVVTGTLVSGVLREGDEVEILPGGARGRIRGLQTHRKRVAEAPAGRRVAVNIQGVATHEAPRGATLTTPGALLTTRRARVRMAWMPEVPAASRRGGPVRFHQGTCERPARLRMVASADLDATEREITLGAETVLLPGDRFILRRPAPLDTIGGGTVLDAHPPERARSERHAARHDSRQDADPLVERVEREGLAGKSASALAAELGWSGPEVESAIATLAHSGRLVRAGGTVLSGALWRSAAERVVAVLGAFHEADPLKPAMPRETLRSQASPRMAAEAFRMLLAAMAAEGVVRLAGERVAMAAHRVVLSAADEACSRRLEDTLRRAGLDPPDPAELLRAVGGARAERLLELLVESGLLVRIRDGRLFHAGALDALRSKVRDFARTSSTMDVAAFKELAGVTRKNAIPLLEQLDQERVTRREGNVRRILTDTAAG